MIKLTQKFCMALGGMSAIFTAGCDHPADTSANALLSTKQVSRLIPARVHGRQEWAADILEVLNEHKIQANKQNVCSVIAIIDQESNFQANPPVPNLGNTALKALKEKIDEKLGPYVTVQFMEMLNQKPSPDNSFAMQLKKIKTEKELDDLYRQMFDFFKSEYHLGLVTGAASIVSGKSIGESLNPVKTLGSMQVHINYAIKHPKDILPVNRLRDYLYTQEGGLYYGIGRLMNYDANYKQPVYRFADYNSGMYSSRNAAVQDWTNKLIKSYKLEIAPIPEDGDLLLYDKSEDPLGSISNSELAIQNVLQKGGSTLTASQIHRDLKEEKSKGFEETKTYLTLKNLYEDQTDRKAPYAQMPQVIISGPKLSHEFNSGWYANRVNGRYLSCMKR